MEASSKGSDRPKVVTAASCVRRRKTTGVGKRQKDHSRANKTKLLKMAASESGANGTVPTTVTKTKDTTTREPPPRTITMANCTVSPTKKRMRGAPVDELSPSTEAATSSPDIFLKNAAKDSPLSKLRVDSIMHAPAQEVGKSLVSYIKAVLPMYMTRRIHSLLWQES